jgi:hypothetical protein
VRAAGVRVARCQEVLRPVAAEGATRNAIDVLLEARREEGA